MYRAKDFIETSEGLVFAVVENELEQGRVLCFLRYICTNDKWCKVNTEQANQLLQTNYPEYLYYSKARDAELHAVLLNRIKTHYQPRIRLQALIKQQSVDAVQEDFKTLVELYRCQDVDLEQVGVTGSLLLGAQNAHSDIDLVVYDRKTFNQIRTLTGQLITANRLQALSNEDWQDAYQRRCCEISLEDYIWHEQRKLNKAMINGRKFDLSLLTIVTGLTNSYKKLGKVKLTAKVTNDEQGFDYPAVFQVDHPEIAEIVCYTATYAGQALASETIEVAGLLEQAAQGLQRIIVGSSREAKGEYLKVVTS